MMARCYKCGRIIDEVMKKGNQYLRHTDFPAGGVAEKKYGFSAVIEICSRSAWPHVSRSRASISCAPTREGADLGCA